MFRKPLSKQERHIAMDADPLPCQEDRWDWDRSTFERQRHIEWEPSCLGVFRTNLQASGFSGITGTRLLKEACEKHAPLPNIKLLEFLKSNPHVAPRWAKDDWYLFFVMPLYVEGKGDVFARFLHWDNRTHSFEEGDTLFKGAGFSSKCGLVTYEGIAKSD